jgi:hypothetical protein
VCLFCQVGQLKQQSADVAAEQANRVGRSGGISSPGLRLNCALRLTETSRHARSSGQHSEAEGGE